MTLAIGAKTARQSWFAVCLSTVALAGFVGEAAAQQATLGVSVGANANSFRSQSPGRRVTYVCAATSANDAPVWGSGPYLDDSAVCVAAIHAGVLKENQAGVVTFVTGGDLGTYSASTKNGVTTEVWGGGGGARSFTFDASGQPGSLDWTTTGQGIPLDFVQPIVVMCPPALSMPDGAGTYGTDVYDDSSHICVAAVHAGAITATGGPIQFTMAGAQPTFTGSTRNGVTTQAWGGGGSVSFKVAAAANTGSGVNAGAAGGVEGITVTVDARGVPTVRWTPVPGATGYVVARWFVGDAACCNNFSPPGAPLKTTTWIDPGTLPKLGNYGYRVYATTSAGTRSGETTFAWKGTTSGGAPTAAAKDPLASGTLTPTATATALPQTAPAVIVEPVAPRYRVLLLGATVAQNTKEAPVTDGQGDEIYAAAFVVQWDRTTITEKSRAVVRTAEYGDVDAAVKDANRIQAGSKARKGGIQKGDVIPNGFMVPGPGSATAGTASSRAFPLLVWEGTLTAGVDSVLVVPSIWERDSADTVYRRYEAAWGESVFPLKSILARPPVQIQTQVPTNFLQMTVGQVFPLPTLLTLTDLALQSVDRPLGLTPAPLVEPYDDRVILVTPEKLGALKAAGSSIDFPIEYAEPDADPVLGGDYTLYLRVERTQ